MTKKSFPYDANQMQKFRQKSGALEQLKYCIESEDIKLMVLHGPAGVGKTLNPLYLGLKLLLLREQNIEKIKIIRSCVPTRDIGFLPGEARDKYSPFKEPYIQIFEKIFGDPKAFGKFEESGHVEFVPTSFLQGTTIDNTFIMGDEVSNFNFDELYSTTTRVGTGSKLVMAGDLEQDYLSKFGNKNDVSGFSQYLEIARNMNPKTARVISFEDETPMRSELVKEFIKANKKWRKEKSIAGRPSLQKSDLQDRDNSAA